MQEQEETRLQEAVRAVVAPPSNTQGVPWQGLRAAAEQFASTVQRVSETIQNFAQNPTLSQVAEAIRQAQVNSRSYSTNLTDFLPIMQAEVSLDSPYRIFDERGRLGAGYPMQPVREFINVSDVSSQVSFESLVVNDSAFEAIRSRISERIDSMSAELLSRAMGVPPVALESHPSSAAQAESTLEGLRRVYVNEITRPKPKQQPEEIDQVRAKVARARQLLQDTSQLLSRVVAGLEVTPEEAQALKARVDAGVEAFK